MAKSKNYRRQLPSGIGRPREKGDRYPSGELKRPKPNAVLVAQRANLCGADLKKSTMAENPLSCAFANKWLTGKEYGAGQKYAAAYRQAGFSPASTTASSAQEVDIESDLTRLSFSQMSDEMISAAWDKVMEGKGPRQEQDASLRQWNTLNAPLSPAQRQQLFLVCIMDSWPQWLVRRIAGRQYRDHATAKAKIENRGLNDEEMDHLFKLENSHWERSRDHLVAGLARVHLVLNPVPNAIHSLPAPKSKKVADSTVYVDQDGAFIREVVRMVPVATPS